MFDTGHISIRVWILTLTGSISYLCLMVFLMTNSPSEKTYSCDIAEISPDYTTAMKENCRKLKSGRI
ncbi:hypothetical protein UFOVP240_225 [uncultured Caudovirales phage]|uniref:Uncharacterized protein n=1 Tax=uncultured Caudovirales phage TaxID=2100421 RepID=A0A6J7WV65_9CAUD|nr:hypothetical protein UFOVP240_225 [uncultured Caudovirales phage]